MTDSSTVVIDKSVRSVFVGNIPYEATEEKLKDIFTEVGPVVSFKLVFDRETGKPKGYGFCEFKDQETALSAMRNLNGFEIAGRTLRVDNACTEKSRMEIQSLMQESTSSTESPYGPPVDPEKAPETISKTVASLPPEQMFQLMQQMKMCIQNNPQEARVMLAQNPQLAYALLQAQVVMRIVDPETALEMLHKSAPQVGPIGAPSNGQLGGGSGATANGIFSSTGGLRSSIPRQEPGGPIDSMRLDPRMPSDGPPPAFAPDLRPPPSFAPEVRVPPPPFPADVRQPTFNEEARRDPRSRDPRATDRPSNGLPNMRNPPPSMVSGGATSGGVGGVGSGSGGPHTGPPPQLPAHLAGADPEKAQLIMQVLQLTDEQIAMLPPQQRESIMVLKEQISQGTR